MNEGYGYPAPARLTRRSININIIVLYTMISSLYIGIFVRSTFLRGTYRE